MSQPARSSPQLALALPDWVLVLAVAAYGLAPRALLTLAAHDAALVDSVVPLLPLGLLAALATGLGALAWGYPFLTSHTAHWHLPVVGEIHVASALFFDIGVFTLVVGSTMLILTGIAHQSVRSHRYNNARADDEAAEQAAAATAPTTRGETAWN